MDEARVVDFLKKRFPEYQELRISNLTNIAAGWETQIHAFSIDYIENERKNNFDWIIRQYPGVYAAQKAQREFSILSGLMRVGYPVPIVRVLEENPTHLGTPFIMMDRIKGHTMSDFMRIQPSKYDVLLELFSKLFVRLHRLDYTKVINEKISSGHNPYFWIHRNLDGYEHVIRTFHKPEFNPVLEWLRNQANEVPCNKPSLTHRDFHPFNILLDEDHQPYVIDWTAWDVTDFRADLGWTLLLHGAFTGRSFRDETLKGYETAAEIQVENIEYFEVLAGLRRMLDVSISFTEGATQRSMREDALDAMRESLEHMTYVHDLIEEHTNHEIPKIEELIKK